MPNDKLCCFGGATISETLVFDQLGDRKGTITHAESALKILEQIESPTAANVRQQLETWRRKGN